MVEVAPADYQPLSMTDFRHVGIIFISGLTQTFGMKRSTAQGTVEDYGKMWRLWATSCSALISQKYSCYVERKMTGITVEFPECLHGFPNVERAYACIFVSPPVIQPIFLWLVQLHTFARKLHSHSSLSWVVADWNMHPSTNSCQWYWNKARANLQGTRPAPTCLLSFSTSTMFSLSVKSRVKIRMLAPKEMFKAPNEGRASRSYLTGETFPGAVAWVSCVGQLRCYCVWSRLLSHMKWLQTATWPISH